MNLLFVYYARLFPLLNGLFILIMEICPLTLIYMSFYSENVSVVLLESCVYSILPTWGNLVANLQILF